MDKLIEMLDSFNRAITVLNHSLLDQQSIYMFFIYVDHLGWLATDKDFSTGVDFRNWLDKYYDLSKLGCASIDLWNTRCSLLHMGTSENQHYDKNKHFRLAFYQNVKYTAQELAEMEKNYPKPTKFIDTSVLFDCLSAGVTKFIEEVNLDSDLRELVLRKSNLRNDLYYVPPVGQG